MKIEMRDYGIVLLVETENEKNLFKKMLDEGCELICARRCTTDGYEKFMLLHKDFRVTVKP